MSGHRPGGGVACRTFLAHVPSHSPAPQMHRCMRKRIWPPRVTAPEPRCRVRWAIPASHMGSRTFKDVIFVYRSLSPKRNSKYLLVLPMTSADVLTCSCKSDVSICCSGVYCPSAHRSKTLHGRGATSPAAAARPSAVRSTPWVRFPAPKLPTRHRSTLQLLALCRSLKTGSDPRQRGPSGWTGIFLSRVEHPVTMASGLLLSGVSGKFVFLRLSAPNDGQQPLVSVSAVSMTRPKHGNYV